MLLLADAYSTGATAGSVVRWLLLAAIAFRLVQRLRSGRGVPAARIGIVVVAALMIGSAYHDFGRGEAAAGPTAQDRTEFMAGCTQPGVGEAFCGCVFDELVAAGYDDDARLLALAVETERSATPPKALTDAAAACS